MQKKRGTPASNYFTSAASGFVSYLLIEAGHSKQYGVIITALCIFGFCIMMAVSIKTLVSGILLQIKEERSDDK